MSGEQINCVFIEGNGIKAYDIKVSGYYLMISYDKCQVIILLAM